MSAPAHIPVAERWNGGQGLFMKALVAGVVGLGISFAGIAIDKTMGFRAYLVGLLFWLGIALGALSFVLICHATRAKWMVVLRRHMEVFTSALPVLFVLFLPLLAGLPSLYQWVGYKDRHLDHHVVKLLEHKEVWLNVGFFVFRAVLYFVLWNFIAHMLRSWSLKQDATGDEALTVKARNFSPGMIVVTAFTLTGAAFDWIMSLEPTWFSTIFGAYYFAGGLVSFFSLLALVSLAAKGKDLPGEHIKLAHMHNIGKFMFAFTCFWGYMGFSQYMLIWVANLPEETSYILLRRESIWPGVGGLLIIGHFFVPFFLLIGRTFKLKMPMLRLLALWILVMNFIDMLWLVMPSHSLVSGDLLSPVKVVLFSAAAVIGVGGISIAVAVRRARGHYTFPIKDPFLADSLRYEQP